MSTPPDRAYLLLADAARALGTTPDALRKRVKRGQVEAVRDNLGRLKVWVPAPVESIQTSTSVHPVQAGHGQAQAGQTSDLASHVQAVVHPLQTHIAALMGELTQARQDAQAQVDAVRREAQAERDQLRDDVAAAHDRLGMALSLVGQIQADAEKERSRLIAEIEAQRLEVARDRVAAQVERDRLVWDALQARQQAQEAKERADGTGLTGSGANPGDHAGRAGSAPGRGRAGPAAVVVADTEMICHVTNSATRRIFQTAGLSDTGQGEV